MMSMRKRLQRGQAAVEMAVSLIAILPIIFYALFLADLTAYKLDMAEAVYSTSWDFMVFDYSKSNEYQSNKPPEVTSTSESDGQPQGGTGGLDRIARLTFCDHYSHYQSWTQKSASRADGSSFESGEECNTENHHRQSGVHGSGVNLAAHQCWMVGGGQQIMCNVEKDEYFTLTTTALPNMTYFNDTYNNGGHVTCNAKLGVMNYFMPQKLFQQFSQRDLTGLKKNEGTVHADAANASAANAIVFKEDKFGMLHDPWAVNWPQDMGPDDIETTSLRLPFDNTGVLGYRKDSKNLFYERMKTHFDATSGPIGLNAIRNVGKNLVQKKLISPTALLDTEFGLNGDNPSTPTLAFKGTTTDRKTEKFFPSAWGDNRQSASSGSRRDQYFGWQNKNKW